MLVTNSDDGALDPVDGSVQPRIRWGTTAPSGSSRRLKSVPIGSLYLRQAAGQYKVYQKLVNNGNDYDWGIMGTRAKRLSVSSLTTGVKDTGWDLPAKALVYDVFVDVRTLEATATTKTIDVGLLASETGGDEDGFMDGASTAAVGLIRGGFAFTDGTNQNYISAATRGVLLYSGLLGGDVAGTTGTVVLRPHDSSQVVAKSVTYTLGSAHTELVADIWVLYLEI